MALQKEKAAATGNNGFALLLKRSCLCSLHNNTVNALQKKIPHVIKKMYKAPIVVVLHFSLGTFCFPFGRKFPPKTKKNKIFFPDRRSSTNCIPKKSYTLLIHLLQ